MWLRISDLKKVGLMQSGQIRSKTLTWPLGFNTEFSLDVLVNLATAAPYMILVYPTDSRTVRCRIELTAKPSNLGVGKVWYFVCPSTRRLCRKLYRFDNYFLHRTAYPNALYQSQAISKNWRAFALAFMRYKEPRKKYYRGKPTRRYLRWHRMVDRASERYLGRL